jgi:hypothetical protein
VSGIATKEQNKSVKGTGRKKISKEMAAYLGNGGIKTH